MLFYFFFYQIIVHCFPQFFLNGCYLLVLNAAGNDMIKIIQVGVYIKGKSMHGDPPAATHADGANLSLFSNDARLDPYPCFTCTAFALDPKFCNGQDDDFFQVA